IPVTFSIFVPPAIPSRTVAPAGGRGDLWLYGCLRSDAELVPAPDEARPKSKCQSSKQLASLKTHPILLSKGWGLRTGLLIYVDMTAGAAVGSTGALRRRVAAEMRVMIRPTGRGSMKV